EQRRLYVIDAVEDPVDGRYGFARRQVSRLGVCESHEAHRIALPQRDIGQQEQGVEGVIEMREIARTRQAALAGAHALTAVEHEDDMLIALVLVLPRDQLSETRCRLPVDLPRAIALPVLAQLVKLQPLTAAAALQHADLRKAVVACEQRVLG